MAGGLLKLYFRKSRRPSTVDRLSRPPWRKLKAGLFGVEQITSWARPVACAFALAATDISIPKELIDGMFLDPTFGNSSRHKLQAGRRMLCVDHHTARP